MFFRLCWRVPVVTQSDLTSHDKCHRTTNTRIDFPMTHRTCPVHLYNYGGLSCIQLHDYRRNRSGNVALLERFSYTDCWMRISLFFYSMVVMITPSMRPVCYSIKHNNLREWQVRRTHRSIGISIVPNNNRQRERKRSVVFIVALTIAFDLDAW